ncbi:MAG: prepilin-type N-terminal cleavage/methylation domain-containing protein [Pseudomonadota bacterium]
MRSIKLLCADAPIRTRSRQAGLTLLELIVVLTILAALGTIIIAQSASLTDDARYQRTVRTLEQLDAAVVGDSDLRGPDGQRLITGFVADMGRPPADLGELLRLGTQSAFRIDRAPPGDTGLAVGSGWRGPYLRLPVGADTLTDGWGRDFEAFDQDGVLVAAPGEIRIVRSRGADRLAGGVGFGRDLLTVFEATAVAQAAPEFAGLVSVVPPRFEGDVVIEGVVVDDGSDPGDDLGFGDCIVIRVYGPDAASGDVLTLAQAVHDLNVDGVAVGVTAVPLAPMIPGGAVSVGPRVIRAYQTKCSPLPDEDLNPALLPGTDRVSRPVYFVNVPGGLPPLPQLVLEEQS